MNLFRNVPVLSDHTLETASLFECARKRDPPNQDEKTRQGETMNYFMTFRCGGFFAVVVVPFCDGKLNLWHFWGLQKMRSPIDKRLPVERISELGRKAKSTP